jgi:hydroxymethylglutaryl-CoA lyase
MSDRPKFVEFREEGPREGLQIEKAIYPLADRVALVEALAETGLKYIQVASFVSPKHVPQMADPSSSSRRSAASQASTMRRSG